MSSNKTNTISTAVAKCFTNIELITNICKFLNYKQQLQFLQVSRELKYIITNFIWNRKYKEVEVYAFKKPTQFLVSDKIDTEDGMVKRYVHMFNENEILQQTNLLFESNELKLLFNLNAASIKKLHLKLISNADLRSSVEVKKLINLNYLRYEKITLTQQDLKIVAENCLKLESLVLFNCFNLKGQPLVLDQDIDIQVIKNMQNLKNFFVNFTGWCYKEHLYNFTNVKHILNQFKLQRLNLEFTIEHDFSAIQNNLTYKNLKISKVFEIGMFDKFKDFLNFQTNILPNFENLGHLTLIASRHFITISKEFFNILLQCCTKLTHLSFEKYHLEFVALPQLQELELQECFKLTWLNLKTILHEMHLKSFKSFSTHYAGVASNFLISDTLEKLQCDFWDEEYLGLLNFNKKNLKNLLYFDWQIWGWNNCSLNLANLAPNLQVLYMPWRYLNINHCFEMKCLQNIILDLDDKLDIDMEELLQLLKHDNLRLLTIDDVYKPNADVNFSQIKAFETKLLHLQVCREVFSALTDFCLDLLQINGKLTLTCFGITCDLIVKMLCNEKFPNRFTSINICGFSIDCSAIRNQCKKTMNLIKLLEDKYDFPTAKCYFTLGKYI